MYGFIIFIFIAGTLGTEGVNAWPPVRGGRAKSVIDSGTPGPILCSKGVHNTVIASVVGAPGVHVQGLQEQAVRGVSSERGWQGAEGLGFSQAFSARGPGEGVSGCVGHKVT